MVVTRRFLLTFKISRNRSHLGMSNLRIYASGLNLFAWNRFKLWDVEQGNDGMQYPIQAVYNFGINLSF